MAYWNLNSNENDKHRTLYREQTILSSRRRVNMTIRLLFSCQTILQKSMTVWDVKGPKRAIINYIYTIF